jgi:hypothetical protein
LVLALLMTLTALPATADWLVTLGGDPVETDGAWEIKGKLIVFTLPGGTLSSMRLADVDLDASERLTADEHLTASGRRPPKAEPERREAVLVLTDSDVGHVDARLTGSMEQRQQVAAEAREQTKGTAAATNGGLSVVDWNQTFDDGIEGVVVTGRLQNRSRGTRAEVTVQVILYRTDGRLAGRAPATLEDTVLSGGEATSLKATFPGILGFDRPEFRIDSTPLRPKAESQPEQEDQPVP